MNLIEQLGGYEEAKKQGEQWGLDDHLTASLLQYRREHNIFEVEDWFVSDAILKPYKIIEKNGDYLKLWCKETTVEFSGNAETITKIFKNARHATEEEIKAGRRLELETLNDHDIPPNTTILE